MLSRPAARSEHIARLVYTLVNNMSPPTPGSDEIVAVVPFDVTTPSQVLGAISAGAVINRVALLISTPFNDPTATLSLGTSANHSLFFMPSDARLSMADQYQSDALVVVPTNEILLLTVNFGAATLGEGVLLYKVLP